MIPVFLTLAAEAGRPPDAGQVEALRQRREGSLDVGEAAPDGAVVKLDGTEARLWSTRRTDRPLVLVFGSFT